MTDTPKSDALRVFAMFLPQFHNDPLNSKWWGDGFDEWVNVKAAEPLYAGHDQPRVPAGGYFKYEDTETLDAHFTEARAHGIDGFIFYHYWSLGTRLLKKPLDALLADKTIGNQSEFSLCWANHSWTRSWKNRSGAKDVLLEQQYETGEEGFADHVGFLVKCFADERYSRIDGKPVFFIYKSEDMANVKEFTDALNKACMKTLGTECHISGMVTSWQSNWSHLDGLSSATLAQPACALHCPDDIFGGNKAEKKKTLSARMLARSLPDGLKKFLYPVFDRFIDKVSFFDYDTVWLKSLRQMKAAVQSDKTIHLSSFVDFDNTARYRNRARIFKNFSPEKYGRYTEDAMKIARANPGSSLLIINAWNEWAEGMYLQADTHHGNARLEEIAKAKRAAMADPS